MAMKQVVGETNKEALKKAIEATRPLEKVVPTRVVHEATTLNAKVVEAIIGIHAANVDKKIKLLNLVRA